LLYNWHPACIFLGDSGALLIGLLIGVIGVEGSMKGPSAISILFPILAMGLPISDTAMAIFRRWVRNLPLSAADRRHVHHLLIGLGLGPRRAALLLYSFSGFLCGAVLLGAALRSEFLALVLGICGCLAFLLVVTSRRDELSNLRGDLRARITRGRQERVAARLTWEGIQRIELCDSATGAFDVVERTAEHLGCVFLQISCTSADSALRTSARDVVRELASGATAVSGPGAVFRFSCGGALSVTVHAELGRQSDLAADIVFRYLERLGQALAGRLEWLGAIAPRTAEPRLREAHVGSAPVLESAGRQRDPAGLIALLSRALRRGLRAQGPHDEISKPRIHVAESVAAPPGFARR
jgi:UDP-GlcNAc:undecaprenyl-phosphate GlcNAc-1-phosphate transferase